MGRVVREVVLSWASGNSDGQYVIQTSATNPVLTTTTITPTDLATVIRPLVDTRFSDYLLVDLTITKLTGTNGWPTGWEPNTKVFAWHGATQDSFGQTTGLFPGGGHPGPFITTGHASFQGTCEIDTSNLQGFSAGGHPATNGAVGHLPVRIGAGAGTVTALGAADPIGAYRYLVAFNPSTNANANSTFLLRIIEQTKRRP